MRDSIYRGEVVVRGGLAFAPALGSDGNRTTDDLCGTFSIYHNGKFRKLL